MNAFLYANAIVGMAFILVCGFSWFVNAREKLHASTRFESFERGEQSERLHLEGASHWFSECPETARVLHELAKGRPVSEVREHWRKTRKERGA